MKVVTALATIAIAAIAGAATASAKTCKEPLVVSSRSTIAGGEDARTKRATTNVQNRWSKEARAKHGFAYKFWIGADAKDVSCRHTPKSTLCTASATPCRLI